MNQLVVVRKNNTYLVVKVKGTTPQAWTIRNVNHNTYFGEITRYGNAYIATAIVNQKTVDININLINDDQELADWAIKALLDDKVKPQR